MKSIIIMAIFSLIYLAAMEFINKKMASIDFPSNTSNVYANQEAAYYTVKISGAVNNPGTYTVVKGANLAYLIMLSGGVKENADTQSYNPEVILINNSHYYIASKCEEVEKVSINKATITKLDTLPGIGSVLATRIVSYRNQNGEFLRLEDIKNVSGIGDVLFEQIKDYICL